MLSFLYAAIAFFSLVCSSALTEADDTSSALSSEKLYSETADAKLQKFGDSLVQYIFSSQKKSENFHSPAGLVWRIVWGTAEQSGTHATDFSPGTLPKGGPENQMGITSRKSINCKTDSP